MAQVCMSICLCSLHHTPCSHHTSTHAGGELCHNLGVGPPVLPLKGLTAERLCAAMQQLLLNSSYKQAAQVVAAKLQAEGGLAAALDSICASLSVGK